MGKIPDIPSGSAIIEEVMEEIRNQSPEMLTRDYVQDNFSDALEGVFELVYKKYTQYQIKTISGQADAGCPSLPDTVSRDKARDLYRKGFNDGMKFEKSLSQSRMSRAGKAFEKIVQDLLEIAGIKSEAVTRSEKNRLGRIDLVVPDRRTAIDTPDQAHFLSLKTTLRERWKQVVQEQRQGQRTHLITLLQGRELISDSTANEIVDKGVFLYVPDRIKETRFSGEPRIRGLSELPARIRQAS